MGTFIGILFLFVIAYFLENNFYGIFTDYKYNFVDKTIHFYYSKF